MSIETAHVYSNTRGSQGLGPDFNNGAISTVLGGIDLDWYTEIVDRGGRKGDETMNLAIFTAGKVAWNLIRGRNPWPYYDPKEAVALRALSLGYGYGDLFPDSLLDKECGPCCKKE